MPRRRSFVKRLENIYEELETPTFARVDRRSVDKKFRCKSDDDDDGGGDVDNEELRLSGVAASKILPGYFINIHTRSPARPANRAPRRTR